MPSAGFFPPSSGELARRLAPEQRVTMPRVHVMDRSIVREEREKEREKSAIFNTFAQVFIDERRQLARIGLGSQVSAQASLRRCGDQSGTDAVAGRISNHQRQASIAGSLEVVEIARSLIGARGTSRRAQSSSDHPAPSASCSAESRWPARSPGEAALSRSSRERAERSRGLPRSDAQVPRRRASPGD